ncbi:MAG: MFS transporter [Pseudonocardiaceae bacterium]
MNPESSPVSYQRLFAVGEFRAILLAHLVSMLGDVIGTVAVTVLVYQETKSPVLAAVAFSLMFLPHVFGGAFVRVIMDRFRPRQVLVACNLLSAVLVGSLTVPGAPVAVVLAVMFVVGMLAPVFVGIRSAVLPDILGNGRLFVLGRSTIRVVSQSAQVVGYLLGGVLLLFLPPQGALAANAASFGIAALLFRFGTRERGRPGRTGRSEPVSRVTLRDVLANRPVRQLLLIGWIAPCFAIAAEALAAPYVAGLGRPERDLALLLSAGAAGMVLADLVCSRLIPPGLQRRLIKPGAVLLCLPMIVFAVQPSLPVAVAILFLSGLGLVYNAGLDALLVERSPDSLLPKALAYQYVLLLGLQGLAVVGWGLLGELVPASGVIAAAGAAGVVAILLVTRRLHAENNQVRKGEDTAMGFPR